MLLAWIPLGADRCDPRCELLFHEFAVGPDGKLSIANDPHRRDVDRVGRDALTALDVVRPAFGHRDLAHSWSFRLNARSHRSAGIHGNEGAVEVGGDDALIVRFALGQHGPVGRNNDRAAAAEPVVLCRQLVVKREVFRDVLGASDRAEAAGEHATFPSDESAGVVGRSGGTRPSGRVDLRALGVHRVPGQRHPVLPAVEPAHVPRRSASTCGAPTRRRARDRLRRASSRSSRPSRRTSRPRRRRRTGRTPPSGAGGRSTARGCSRAKPGGPARTSRETQRAPTPEQLPRGSCPRDLDRRRPVEVRSGLLHGADTHLPRCSSRSVRHRNRRRSPPVGRGDWFVERQSPGPARDPGDRRLMMSVNAPGARRPSSGSRACRRRRFAWPTPR